jgi:hypothetical protein
MTVLSQEAKFSFDVMLQPIKVSKERLSPSYQVESKQTFLKVPIQYAYFSRTEGIVEEGKKCPIVPRHSHLSQRET